MAFNITKVLSYASRIKPVCVGSIFSQLNGAAPPLLCNSSSSLQLQQERAHRYLKRRPIGVIKHGPENDAESFDEYFNRVKADAEPLNKKADPIKKKDQNIPKQMDRGGFISSEIESHLKSDHKSLKGLHLKLFENATDGVEKLLSSSKSAPMREREDIFVVEGWRLLAEALIAGLKPRAIFYTRSRLLGQMGPLMSYTENDLVLLLNSLPLYKIPYRTIQQWSSLRTSPGIMGVFNTSQVIEERGKHQNVGLPLTVILDQIRDPSNVGSIIRTLAAVGVSKVIFIKGCCNPFDIKTLRSGSGSLFRMNFEADVEWSSITGYLPEEPTVYLADSCKEEAEANYFTRFDDEERLVVNEEANNQRLADLEAECLTREKQDVYEVGEDGIKIYSDLSYDDHELLKKFEDVRLPMDSYSRADYYSSIEDGSVVLVIGGETGLSERAKKFSCENRGVQVAIPMQTGMDSLNSSVATGVILYEMLKNYRSKVPDNLDQMDENKNQ